MIAYVSFPYSLQHPATQEVAIAGLGKVLAKLYKDKPNYVFVNPLYTFHKNPYAEKGSSLFEVKPVIVQALIETFMKSADLHIIVRHPGWEYSDVVLSECAVSNRLGMSTLYYELR